MKKKSKKPYHAISEALITSAKIRNKCNHDFVYKIMHDHSAADVCAKCGLIVMQGLWNMSEADKRYYDRIAAHEEKRSRALAKARARGTAAEKWFSENKLTKETQAEFNALMKKADKEFDTHWKLLPNIPYASAF